MTPFVVVLVGATIVGSMSTVWHGVINPPRSSHQREWQYADPSLVYDRGQEMGRFQLGSTVVLLAPDRIAFNPLWAPGGSVRLGESMAESLAHNPVGSTRTGGNP